MLPFIKLLKILLPVTTVTAATIATVSLVSFQKADNKLDKEAEDKVLEDFEKPVEEFKEQTMLYSENGQGDGVTVTEEMRKQLEGKVPTENQDKGSDISEKDSAPQVSKDSQELSENPNEKENGELVTPTSLDTKDSEVSSASPSLPLNPKADPADVDSSEPKVASDIDEGKENVSGEPSGDEEAQKSEVTNGTESSLSDQEVNNSNDGDADEAAEDKDLASNPDTQEDNPKLGDQSKPTDDVSLVEDDSRDPQPSLNTEKTTQDGENSSLNTNENGRQDGIKGEHGTDEMNPEQIKRMIQLEEDTLSALNSLQNLIE